MRFRNIMLDSGTPFRISKEIASTAEFPEQMVRRLEKVQNGPLAGKF